MDLFGLDRAGPVKRFFLIILLLIAYGVEQSFYYVKFNLFRVTPKGHGEKMYVLKLEQKRARRYL